MKTILTLEPGFPPELASSRLYFEFAREMTKLGHNVLVVTVFPRKYLLSKEEKYSINMKAKRKFFYFELMNNFIVMRIKPQFSSNSLLSRILEQILVPISLLIGGLLMGMNLPKKNTVIHCTIPPLFIGFSACLIGRLLSFPVIVRVQDAHPDALVKLGLIKNRTLIRLLEIIEKFVYLRVDYITVIGDTYKEHIISRGISPDKVILIPNWADVSKISQNTDLKFRKDMKLEGKFIITYAGTISWPQDLETVIRAAEILKKYENIVFLIVGEGIKKKLLIELSKKLNLNNVIFLPLQPREKYFEILKSSNICLVSLKKTFQSPSVPSKILDIMACAKPIVANIPLYGDTPKILKEAKCGLVVEPENPYLLAQLILLLYNNPALAEEMGKNGLHYLEKNFSLPTCIQKYEEIIMKACK
jgi:colanic acid biosynthesis glycosyl transferase WcaI